MLTYLNATNYENLFEQSFFTVKNITKMLQRKKKKEEKLEKYATNTVTQ